MGSGQFFWRVGGQQNKYAGQTCLFSRDNGALLSKLPLLPTELNVLIIKSKGNQADQQNAAFGRRPKFQVKRAWLLANFGRSAVSTPAIHPLDKLCLCTTLVCEKHEFLMTIQIY